MKKIEVKILLLFNLFFLVSQLSAADIKVTATVNSNRIAVDEQFAVTLQVEGGSVNSIEPVLPDLDEFAAYTGSNQSSNFQFINGRMSASKTITYYFIARKTGKFTIPAISVRYKGKDYKSQPIRIEITKAAQQQSGQVTGRSSRRQAGQSADMKENIYLKAEINNKKVFVGEPVTVSYKIYTALQVTNYSFRNKPNYGDFWSEEFDQNGSPRTFEKIINGRRFIVATLKKLVLFPTSAGRKTIPPQEIEATIRMRERRARRDIFDSFFDDPFFGRTVNKKLKSNPLTIEVLPLPVAGRPASFSGSVGRFSMTTSIDNRQVETNDAITVKVVIAGQGNIRTLNLAKPKFPASFEVYDPKIKEKIDRSSGTIKGRKTFEYLLVPREPGQFRIDPITFTYFDIREERYKTLSRGAFDITVKKGEKLLSPPPRGWSKSEVKLLGKDIRYISLEMAVFTPVEERFYRSLTLWFLLIAPLLVVGGGMAYRRHQEKLGTNVAYARSRKAQKLASRQLKAAHTAMKNGDVATFYTELARALTTFVGNKLNVQESSLVREQLTAELAKCGIEKELVDSFDAVLQECDFHRFALPDAPETAMQQGYKKVDTLIVSLEKKL